MVGKLEKMRRQHGRARSQISLNPRGEETDQRAAEGRRAWLASKENQERRDKTLRFTKGMRAVVSSRPGVGVVTAIDADRGTVFVSYGGVRAKGYCVNLVSAAPFVKGGR